MGSGPGAADALGPFVLGMIFIAGERRRTSLALRHSAAFESKNAYAHIADPATRASGVFDFTTLEPRVVFDQEGCGAILQERVVLRESSHVEPLGHRRTLRDQVFGISRGQIGI